MLTYSNPRRKALFPNWPCGRFDRVQCLFQVEETPRKGFRVRKSTTKPGTSIWNKPKYGTYAGPAAIVDGSDGKTYIIQYVNKYDFFKIMTHDFMSADDEGGAVFPKNEEQYKTLKELLLATRPE